MLERIASAAPPLLTYTLPPVRRRYAGSKGISSDQFFGSDDSDAHREATARMQVRPPLALPFPMQVGGVSHADAAAPRPDPLPLPLPCVWTSWPH